MLTIQTHGDHKRKIKRRQYSHYVIIA